MKNTQYIVLAFTVLVLTHCANSSSQTVSTPQPASQPVVVEQQQIAKPNKSSAKSSPISQGDVEPTTTSSVH